MSGSNASNVSIGFVPPVTNFRNNPLNSFHYKENHAKALL
jgi:hypothetical protein